MQSMVINWHPRTVIIGPQVITVTKTSREMAVISCRDTQKNIVHKHWAFVMVEDVTEEVRHVEMDYK